MLTDSQQSILAAQCANHLVAFCGLCDARYTPRQLGLERPAGVRRYVCPRCSRDLLEGVKAHVHTCSNFRKTR